MAEPAYPLISPEDGRDWPAPGEWTYEDYLRLPEDGRRYEVIRGSLYVAAAPNLLHQFVAGELFSAVRGFVRQRALGSVLNPIEVHLPGGITSPVQPDLVFLGRDKRFKWSDTSFHGVPDLLAEVLSPRTRRVDQKTKFAAYRDAGVREYWLIDPLAETFLVYVLSEDRRQYLELCRGGMEDILWSAVLAGFRLRLRDLFPPED
jgi:Uma2 family endonuclease